MQVTKSIHQIPGLRSSNVYLYVQNDGKLILIDSGMPGSQKKIGRYISSIGRNPGDIEYVLLTHPDIDHSGGLALLKQSLAPQAKVAIHVEDAPKLAGDKKLKETRGSGMRVMMGLMGLFVHFTPVKPDILLQDHDTIGGLETIFTPGHTSGSVCFLSDSEKALFAGDTLRTNSTSVMYTPDGISFDPETLRKSVKTRLANLSYNLLLPGHGPPILEHADQLVRALVGA